MQSQFRFDAYSADEQAKIKRLFFRTLGVYSLLVLMFAVAVTAKSHLAPTAAVAAERTGSPLCAARDLCRAGRVTEALAVYDGIAIAPIQSAAK
jgi:hypothetical protein